MILLPIVDLLHSSGSFFLLLFYGILVWGDFQLHVFSSRNMLHHTNPVCKNSSHKK
jgi:hypothetical protein